MAISSGVNILYPVPVATSAILERFCFGTAGSKMWPPLTALAVMFCWFNLHCISIREGQWNDKRTCIFLHHLSCPRGRVLASVLPFSRLECDTGGGSGQWILIQESRFIVKAQLKERRLKEDI